MKTIYQLAIIDPDGSTRPPMESVFQTCDQAIEYGVKLQCLQIVHTGDLKHDLIVLESQISEGVRVANVVVTSEQQEAAMKTRERMKK